MKKWTSVLVVTVLIASMMMVGFSGEMTRVGWVKSNDEAVNYWNAQITEVLDTYEAEGLIKYKVFSSTSKNPKKSAVEQSAKIRDLTIGTSWMDFEAVSNAALNFPSKSFIFIDASAEDLPSNLTCYTFKMHEGSFIAGVIAAATTETDKIGFVGGMDFPLINQFEIGYRAGALTVNPDIKIEVVYADSFTDEELGYDIGEEQFLADVDVIFHAAGSLGNGIIAAAEANTSDEDHKWVIGVDMDQSYLNEDHVLCSVVKNYGKAVDFALEMYFDDPSFAGGTHELGIAEEAVGISDFAGNLSEEAIEQADFYMSEITEGNIVVPMTYDELED